MRTKRWIILWLAAVASSAWFGANVGHRIGYKDGWMAHALDSFAVEKYHHEADALSNDDDAQALAAIWAKCMADAQRQEAEWQALSVRQKWKYPTDPFWKRGVGEPRRISKSQQEKFVKALQGK